MPSQQNRIPYSVSAAATSQATTPKGSSPTTSVNTLYDGEGHRVEQQVSQYSCSSACGTTTTTTQYVAGGAEDVTLSASGTTTAKYYAAGGLMIGVNVNGTTSYLASDGLGSVSTALSSGGTLVATRLFAPYGGVRYSSGSMPTARGFTGQYGEATSGLDYYGARFYDPVAGQFTSADDPQGGQGPNRYAYVLGNPETRTDPTGRHCDSDGCGGGKGGGGGGGTPPATKHTQTQTKCDQVCQLKQQISEVFQDSRTQEVMFMLLNSDVGIQFLQFLLAVGKRMGGDTYISWGLAGSALAYTNFDGTIELNPAMLTAYGNDAKGLTEGLISAAGALVHEAVESYYAIEDNVRSQASQHMDYVAEWFAGEVKEQLAGRFNVSMPGGSAYLLTFAQWQASGDGQAYASEPVNQPEVSGLLNTVIAQVAGNQLFGDPPDVPNAMGLSLDMLTALGLPGSGPQNIEGGPVVA